MNPQDALPSLLAQHGFDDFLPLDPHEVVLGEWVRMKCRFGCQHYGKSTVCPPHTPPLPQCRSFFDEYRTAFVIRCRGTVAAPEDRHDWTRTINQRLLDLERSVFLAGFVKAFVLFVDPCNLCMQGCPPELRCRRPHQARPAPEAMGVDVFSSVRRCGYEIQVLTDYSQEMSRFGLLLVE